MFAAVLDTCAIYAGVRRDLLLSMAAGGVFRVVIGDELLDEIEQVERLRQLTSGTSERVAAQRARHLVDRIRQAFEVEDAERVRLVGELGLPDPGDEHVARLAVAGRADVIVTDNLKDFPPDRLPEGLRVQEPASFLHDMVTADPFKSHRALREMSERRRTPPQSPRDLLDIMLLKGHMSGVTADVLREQIDA